MTGVGLGAATANDVGDRSIRDFFQICSVGDANSRSSDLRFFVSGTNTAASSSSDSKVRSMTSDSTVSERGGWLPMLAEDVLSER